MIPLSVQTIALFLAAEALSSCTLLYGSCCMTLSLNLADAARVWQHLLAVFTILPHATCCCLSAKTYTAQAHALRLMPSARICFPARFPSNHLLSSCLISIHELTQIRVCHRSVLSAALPPPPPPAPHGSKALPFPISCPLLPPFSLPRCNPPPPPPLPSLSLLCTSPVKTDPVDLQKTEQS